MFFRVVLCSSKHLISRAWFEDDIEEQRPDSKLIGPWNQEYYVSFGAGERFWVNIPHTGYMGIGIVRNEIQKAKDV